MTDTETGLITIKQTLDREEKDRYTLVLVVQDMGLVPQQATRLLHVIVTDIDDHKPVFKRTLVSQKLRYVVILILQLPSYILMNCVFGVLTIYFFYMN